MARTWQTTTAVDADFSQFYLRGVSDVDAGGETSLAFFEAGDLLLTAAVQFGALPVQLSVFDARPKRLGADWKDVVEVSVRATDDVQLAGWDPASTGIPLPLEPGLPYRLRYAIDDMTRAREQMLAHEQVDQKYSVDLWPEDPTPAQVVRQETPSGRYWRVARGLDIIRFDIADRDDPTATSEERVTEFAARAFAAYPDLRADVAADIGAVRDSTASTAAMLWRHTIRIPTDFEQQRAESEAARARIVELLVEKANPLLP